jgi:uncharacterized protein YutE (UPF0331/DUF86 family)
MHEVLFRKLERLKEEILYLEKNRTVFLKNIKTSLETKKITERSVYLCAEMTLDIADLVITLRSLPKPSTYSDAIYKLGDHKIIPISFSRKIVYIAGLRNFLAHDYLIDTVHELIRFLKVGITDIKKFINFIEKL